MRLGGFVIHGNSAQTLGECLESLTAVCDEVVAVDSLSTDGSAGLVTAHGVRSLVSPWKGYGAARAVAAKELSACDWLLYLDADERLGPAARDALIAVKSQATQASSYRLAVNDWADLPSGRFLYRTHYRVRLLRREVATWTPEMIVHEALHQPSASRLAIAIEHRFATEIAVRAKKERLYALLWAVRAQAEGRRGKWPVLQRPVMFFRDAFVLGAGFRGGLPGLRLAWNVAAYHAQKYRFLAALRAGHFAELTQAFAAGDYAEVFALARAALDRTSPSTAVAHHDGSEP